MTASPRAGDLLRAMYDEAVASVNPETAVPPHLPEPPRGRTVVLAAGKGAAAMARAVDGRWQGPLGGLAVVPYGYAVPCGRIEVVEARHPVPDGMGQAAAARFLGAASGLCADDLLIFLLSGGASALLVEPAPGLSLATKSGINEALLLSGAPIGAVNCLRRHLSAVKGGRLAAAASPARVATLAVSDVPGDDPVVIGSGPTVADPTSCGDALAVAREHGIPLPGPVRRALGRGVWESVKPGDPRLEGATYRIVSRPADALAAAAARAAASGLRVENLGDDLEGEARELAREHAAAALRIGRGALVSGGETTVTVGRSGGRGGRNCEYLLALAIALSSAPGVHAIACDTDGIDGSGDAAGAVIGPDTLARARAAGLDPARMLDAHDSHSFFAALGDLVVTGPTHTNVNDFRAIVVEGA